MIDTIQKYMPTKRKIMQLYFGLLMNANLKGFVTGNIYQGGSKVMCAPGINCYSCPGAAGACPLGSLQGSFSADHSTIYYVGGILLLYSVLFGRMICGWACPFGLIQELFYKIPTPKAKKSPFTRLLSYLKYAILVFFVFVIPIMYAFRDTPLPAFCKYICPAGTLEGGIGLLSNKVNASYFSMLGPLFTWKFMLMISILVASVFLFRFFCRFLCPLGALYGLFNKFSFFGVKVDDSKCTNCGLCVSHCKLDIHHVADQECISCGECIGVCPTKAISFKGGKIALHPNEGTASDDKLAKKRKTCKIITTVVMAAVLIGAIGYYWSLEDTPNLAIAGNTDRGNQVGDLCYDYDLTIVDGTGITETTIDPTRTGKITIVNFWGTWCTPCVNELPYFDQIATDYADEVSVIAVHSSLSAETAPDYIAKHYPDTLMTFAKDDGLDEVGLVGAYYSALGGRGAYPYTIIMDENGIVLEVFVSSLEYEDLQRVVEARLAAR